MNIVLYNNSSSNNVVSKSLQQLASYTCIVKQESSIIDPVIILSGVNAALMAQANYIYLAEFHRYYFIQNTTSSRDGVWRIDCHVDVLMSYAAQIKAREAVIARQESKYNLYLNDGHFKTYQKSIVTTKTFPQGFPAAGYVLAVSG